MALSTIARPSFPHSQFLNEAMSHGMPDGSWWRVFDKTWSYGEGNGKQLQYSCLKNPMNSMKRQNDRILKEELPRSVGAQYATGDQCRNNSKKKEETERKQKQHPVVDVTGD